MLGHDLEMSCAKFHETRLIIVQQSLDIRAVGNNFRCPPSLYHPYRMLAPVIFTCISSGGEKQ